MAVLRTFRYGSTKVAQMVSRVTSTEKTAGTKNADGDIAMFTPKDVKDMIDEHASGGAIYVPASGVAQSGGGNATIALTPSPALSAYAAGVAYEFVIESDISADATINVSALGAKHFSFTSSKRVSSLKAGHVARVLYDGTRFLLASLVAAVLTATSVEFTTSNSSYAWPYAATKCLAVIDGAGGGGGAGYVGYGGGGGGAGDRKVVLLTGLSVGDVIAITVGAGGAGGTSGSLAAGGKGGGGQSVNGGDGGGDSSLAVGGTTYFAGGGSGGGCGPNAIRGGDKSDNGIYRFGGSRSSGSGRGGSGGGGTSDARGADSAGGTGGEAGATDNSGSDGANGGTASGGSGGASAAQSNSAAGNGGNGGNGKVTLYPIWA